MKKYNIVPRSGRSIKAILNTKIAFGMIDFGGAPFSYCSVRIDLTNGNQEGKKGKSNPQKDVQI